MKRWGLRIAALTLLIGIIVFSWGRYGPHPPAPVLAPLSQQIDRIEIYKSARTLTVFRDDVPLRTYDIALGFAPEGDKQQEGDGKTPEGDFIINRRNPNSAFHLSLGLNYPRPQDIARAKADGVSPGGDIFIHGQPNGLGKLTTLANDWTAGCIAISDAQIQELWRVTPNGTPVTIFR